MTVGDARQLFDIGPHVARAQRAVDADAERPGVGDGHPERVDRLARERPSAAIGDGDRYHQRQADPLLVEHVLDSHNPGLGVERVDDRLEQQEIAAAVDQAAGLLFERRAQLVERHVAEGGIVHVRGYREDAVRGPHRAGHEPGAVGGPCRPVVGHAPSDFRRLEVELVGDRLEAVIRLCDGVAVEGIGLDDVGARFEILAMDLGDHVGARQHQDVVVSFEVAAMAAEARTAELLLRELVTLDHGSHGTVEHQDSRSQEVIQARERGDGRRHGLLSLP